MSLKGCQQRAIEFVRAKNQPPLVSETDEITINFHPDRFTLGACRT